MSEPTPSTPAGAPTPPSDPDEIRAEIEQTRADLADTVDALSAKLDVKARAGDKAHELKQSVADATTRAKESAPPQVQQSLDRAQAVLEPAVGKAVEAARPYRTQLLIGVAVAVVLLVVRRRIHKHGGG